MTRGYRADVDARVVIVHRPRSFVEPILEKAGLEGRAFGLDADVEIGERIVGPMDRGREVHRAAGLKRVPDLLERGHRRERGPQLFG